MGHRSVGCSGRSSKVGIAMMITASFARPLERIGAPAGCLLWLVKQLESLFGRELLGFALSWTAPSTICNVVDCEESFGSKSMSESRSNMAESKSTGEKKQRKKTVRTAPSMQSTIEIYLR
jgi:hypothetical protein